MAVFGPEFQSRPIGKAKGLCCNLISVQFVYHQIVARQEHYRINYSLFDRVSVIELINSFFSYLEKSSPESVWEKLPIQ